MSESYPRPETPDERPLPRNPIGWIVLVVLFAYLMASTTARTTQESPRSRVARYTTELRSAVATKESAKNPIARALSDGPPDAPLRKLERESAPDHRADPIAAVVWVTARRQLGEPVAKADLAALLKSPENAIYAEAYGDAKRTPAAAQALVKRLEARGPVSRIAADYVRGVSGLPKRADTDFTARAVATGLFVSILAFASLAAWFITLGLVASGTFPPTLGPATEVRSAGEADRLALRAAALFTTFFGLQIVVGLLARPLGLGDLAVEALAFGGMLAATPFVLGGRAGMARIGLSLHNLRRDVGLGLWAFLLELPVTLIVAITCAKLLQNLPTPTHPATTALADSPDFWTILVTFSTAAIVAPLWEESMFRGLLFPALRRVLGGPIVAALVSSFLFASIHPQGPVLWAALATVALFSCVLAQRTRSLVPSVVMHCAHNAALVILTILAGRG